ncbi:MAG: radical SAM family heme chaperone HemW [Oscillospiraceae bacterium]|nr:radical SAM family heme chaperone HemW [Oscillospiraceae bacterium]
MDKHLGIYIHIPFCASRCRYCDFSTTAGQDKLMPRYQDALLSHIRESAPQLANYYIDSVYFGGGTPSYYRARRLCELFNELNRTGRVLKTAEVTVECNPDSVRRHDLRMLRKEGVNRLSLGAQCANDDILKLIGRRHNWKQVELAVQNARKEGFSNLSLDLIYGLPSQTKDDWADTLSAAVSLHPEHISCYGLKLEPGTPLYEQKDSPLLPDDDVQADMYLYTVDTLKRQGYQQYEISNFSLPGFESRHNLNYGQRKDYLGLGCAAHSCMGDLRYSNVRDLNTYISAVSGETNIVEECEKLTPLEAAAEYIMLGMRTVHGICREEYLTVYNSSFDALEQLLKEFEKNSWAKCSDDRWHFTAQGFLLSNILIGMLLEAQTQERFQANPWVRDAFENVGERVPLPRGDTLFV